MSSAGVGEHDAGTCPRGQACSFYQAVIGQPRMLMKYASMHHYCRGGDYTDCVRYRAMLQGARPSANMLPSGDYDVAVSGEPSRVLVVDDTPVFLKLLEGMVAAHVPGAAIVGHTSSANALVDLQAGEFDLIVSDFNMPELDGAQLVAEIRRLARGADTPVIIYTTEEDSDKRTALLAWRKTRWVSKSPDRAEFADAVRALLYEGRD